MARMKRLFLLSLALFLTSGDLAQSSIFGPWRRYRSETLGFQVPMVDDWRVTELKNCVVFAMQHNPDPYVRLAVGRMPAGKNSFEQTVRQQLAHTEQSNFLMIATVFEGYPAYRVEGNTANGRILDLYVDAGVHHYWISFIADQPDKWSQYAESFDLILRDFRFL